MSLQTKRKKTGTEGYVWYDFFYLKYPEYANLYRQKID